MREPGGEHALQTHHARGAITPKHIHVERYAHFKLGEFEQAFHQHIRVNRACAGLNHDADFAIRFVADVGQDWQFFIGNQLRDLLNQLALLHAVRNFGDHRDPRAAS